MKDWCEIKQKIVRIAVEEEGVIWTDSSGNKRVESESAMLAELERYWNEVPGINAHDAAINSANNTEPWSAAFISYVFSDAGIERSDGFLFARKHITYIVGALRNRENSDLTKPFWLHDNIEMLHEATPAPGDLICYNRFDQNGNYSNHSYSSLRARYWNNNDAPSGVSHCDVVVSITERNGQQIIDTIGGNVNGSVRYTYLTIVNDQFMKVEENGNNPQQENDIFGIIKNLNCPEFPIS
ncbi:MAG TPA: DUF2272 domain-containing protein [Chitinophagaceae bacterium]|jgi:hypothetical protein|nr:DUF2272 domain-containing protein [Chitinophagaceae bacterium]